MNNLKVGDKYVVVEDGVNVEYTVISIDITVDGYKIIKTSGRVL